MRPVEAGLQGAVPELNVKPVDPNLPLCQKVTVEGPCTRKQGHYGDCGVVK